MIKTLTCKKRGVEVELAYQEASNGLLHGLVGIQDNKIQKLKDALAIAQWLACKECFVNQNCFADVPLFPAGKLFETNPSDMHAAE